MAQKRDYYEVLGVGKQATHDEIKKAYRKLAIKYHPDKNQDNAEAERFFKEATEAYEVLGNTEKKKIYDTYGFEGVNASFQSSGGHDFSSIFREFGDIFGNSGSSFNFENLFSGFGGSRGGRGSTRGGHKESTSNINVIMRLSLEEIITGVEKSFKYERYVKCSNCKGNRTTSSKNATKCSYCNGTGQTQSRAFGGFFAFATTCQQCGGEGVLITDPCRTCHGKGIIIKRPTIKVKIPKGVHEGHVLTLKQQGHEFIEGTGDIQIQIEIRPHRYYVRDFNDLITVLPIDFVTSSTGGIVILKSITGEEVKITIPNNTKTGTVITVAKKGIEDEKGRVGNLRIQVEVNELPKLSPKMKELLLVIKKEMGDQIKVNPIEHHHYR